jgi:hypothetical protein
MEMLEAFQAIPPKGKNISIFYIRGRVKKMTETTNETGEKVSRLGRGKIRSICVAADNLYDAIMHLREYRPNFHPTHVNCRGILYFNVIYPNLLVLDEDPETCEAS